MTASAPGPPPVHGGSEPDPTRRPTARLTIDRSLAEVVLPRVLAPSPSLVLSLQTVRGYPCVSLLANTTPGETMTDTDVRRLRAMSEHALGRLDQAGHAGHGSAMAATLSDLVTAASTARTGVATAILASRAIGRVVRLAIPVAERTVVDHTFATRDLVRTLHRTPRHLILVLESHRARLLDGGAGELRPAATGAFPLHSQTDLTQRSGEEDRHTFLDLVDRRLGLFRTLHPCPLVVMGHPRVVADYLRLARHADRLAGVLRSTDVPTSVRGLQSRIKPVIVAYLASRQREALHLLESRAASAQVVSGIHAAWAEARRGQPEMLAVEPGLMLPARLDTDGETLTLTEQLGDPEVVDDIVDELIELVLARGGWVAFIEDGLLAHHDGIALTLR